MPMTITEALAEIKLIDKKVEKKTEAVKTYLVRQNCLRDPFEGEGGSRKVLEQEQQSIRDLLTRKVVLRTAIANANARTTVAVAGDSKTISEWLIWRREVAPTEQKLVADIRGRLEAAKNQVTQRGRTLSSSESVASLDDFIVNIDESKLVKRAEQLEVILATLDGQLSLRNATVSVEV